MPILPLAPPDTTELGENWQGQAACRLYEPELFFPFDTDRRAITAAKAICRRQCPVAAECLEAALGLGADDGIWGGLTPDERRHLRRTRREPQR